MSESQEGNAAPQGAESTAEQHQLSRRSVVRAGLVAVPILMTLPVVPAWARTAASCATTGHWATNTATHSTHHGCSDGSADSATHGAGGKKESAPAGALAPFGPDPFQSPFK